MKSLYPHAAEKVRNWVLKKGFVEGTGLPSSETLAAQFGFTAPTMLRACQALVSAGFLQRVGYKLQVGPGHSRSPNSEGMIYVVSYMDDFIRIAERYLTQRGISYRQVRLSWTKHLRLEPVIRNVLEKKPGGLIFGCPTIDEGAVALLAASGVPVVLCADVTTLPELSSVSTDFSRGTEVALRHLTDLGHSRIAHVSLGNDFSARELASSYRAVCLKLDLEESASRVWHVENADVQTVQHAIQRGRVQFPKVTAIFADDRVAVLATKAFNIPKDFSLVGFYGLPSGLECRPRLTTIAISDTESAPRLGCTQLIAQMETMASGRPPRPPSHWFCLPDLLLRQSTKALTARKSAPEFSFQSPPQKPHPSESWRKVYPFLSESSSENWRQLDLAKLANHSMKRQHGWLGSEPLLHFPPGLRCIHGIPFQVLDEERNEGHAVITFRTPHSHSAERRKLPTSVRIKVNTAVQALYFLHGCGFARPIPFAEYIIHFKKGEFLSVPLVPLGLGSPTQELLFALRPNVQDWWPDSFIHEDFPHAYHAKIFDPTDPAMYERTIYSLEWINPRPEEEISLIEVKVDPVAGPTLALIAVTALI